MLERDEYVEQAHFFRVLGERMKDNIPLQDLLGQVREELLSTTRLPLAVGFFLDELKHAGTIHSAMVRLPHYFTAFQSYIMKESENERGRFDYRIALEVLRFEAEYRVAGITCQGLFLYQFETLCRNRLRYDHGLTAIAGDPAYNDAWRGWILSVRRRLGMVDLAELIYVRSAQYEKIHLRDHPDVPLPEVLFGEKEGKIALANRRKDPLYLFAAMQRHLNYPSVPRPKPTDDQPLLLGTLARRLEQLETRIKLLEDDQRGGFDLTKFYEPRPE